MHRRQEIVADRDALAAGGCLHAMDRLVENRPGSQIDAVSRRVALKKFLPLSERSIVQQQMVTKILRRTQRRLPAARSANGKKTRSKQGLGVLKMETCLRIMNRAINSRVVQRTRHFLRRNLHRGVG